MCITLTLSILLQGTQWGVRLATSYSSPLVIVGTVCLFMFFANLSISYNSIINWVASSMLPVYLIHEGGNVSHWYYSQIGTWIKELSINEFIIHTILLIIILFIFAILIDQPRKWIWKLLLTKIGST